MLHQSRMRICPRNIGPLGECPSLVSEYSARTDFRPYSVGYSSRVLTFLNFLPWPQAGSKILANKRFANKDEKHDENDFAFGRAKLHAISCTPLLTWKRTMVHWHLPWQARTLMSPISHSILLWENDGKLWFQICLWHYVVEYDKSNRPPTRSVTPWTRELFTRSNGENWKMSGKPGHFWYLNWDTFIMYVYIYI